MVELKKSTIKTLSLLLAVLLLTGIFPVTAVANEGTENSVPEGVTAELRAPETPSGETAFVPGTPAEDGTLLRLAATAAIPAVRIRRILRISWILRRTGSPSSTA